MPRMTTWAIGLFFAAASICPFGCALAAWIAAITTPPETIEPEFVFPEIPAKPTMLVLVDESTFQSASYPPIRQTLTQTVNQHLEEQGVAGNTVSVSRLLKYAAATPGYQLLSIQEIGEAMQADYVVYVKIVDFRLQDSPDVSIWNGRLEATARVVDARSGQCLWPLGLPDGFPVEPVIVPRHNDSSPRYAQRLAKEMARTLGDRVAKLFYEHEGPPHDSLPEREIPPDM